MIKYHLRNTNQEISQYPEGTVYLQSVPISSVLATCKFEQLLMKLKFFGALPTWRSYLRRSQLKQICNNSPPYDCQ